MNAKISTISDAIDEVEYEEHRRQLLVDMWRYLGDFEAPRHSAAPARFAAGNGGPVRARPDVVRELKRECMAGAAVTQKRMERILALGMTIPSPVDQADGQLELFVRREE